MGDMNVILSLNEYSIYDCNNYYLCVPNENNVFYHVFMGFSSRDLRKLSKERLIIEIRKIADSINTVYKNAVYVLPVVDPLLLKEAATENDDREYNRLLKNIIQPIALSVYSKLVAQNKRVSQIIKMIKQNDIDKKLIGWLSMKLGDNFIKEITFEEKVEIPNSSISYHIDDEFITDNQIPVDYQIDDMLVSNSNEIPVNYQIDDMVVSKANPISVDYQIDDVFVSNSSQVPVDCQIDDIFMSNDNQISIDYQINDVWIKNEENKISKTLKPAFSPGFSALKFLLLVFSISLVLGTILGYLILK